jgi:hypothetical protein
MWLLLWMIALAVLLVTKSWLGTFVFAALSVGVFIGPALLDAVAAPGYQFLWQGRYSLPVVVGIPVLVVAMYDRRRVRAPSPIGRVLATTIIVVVLVAETVALFAVLRTYLSSATDYLVVEQAVPTPSPLLVATSTVIATALAASSAFVAVRLNRAGQQVPQVLSGSRPGADPSKQSSSAAAVT